ncbi:MAG: 1-hydroxycarotenoid 3,4-desaturase CrtD [Opitutales bacterium]
MNIVIGAGLGGLAAAIRLAARGEPVTVFEANAYAGGKATVFELDGFRFDAGPSLFTLPAQVDALFELAGENPRDFFNYEKQSEACRYFWNDGQQFTASGDPEQFAQGAAACFEEPVEHIDAYLKRAAASYEALGTIFLKKSLHRADTWWSSDVLKAIPTIRPLELLGSMDLRNRKAFDHPRLVQLFNRFATYNGSDPFRAPGLLTMIPHLEHGVGTFFPKGGIHAITEALYALALRLGVVFHFQSPVSEIEYNSAREITGVKVESDRCSADRVVCNMDVVPAYRRLLRGIQAPERTLSQERSSSALIFYWGVGDTFPELGLHNIFFADDYLAEFRDIFENKCIHEDPTVYIHISSKCEDEDAPEGSENWFVMVNAPHDTNIDWELEVDRVRALLIEKLGRLLGRDLRGLIRCERILTPLMIEERTQSFQGALYGAASNDPWAAFLRHPNKAKNPDGLYFVGGSVHPGGGIPLVLNSAEIVADLIAKEKVSV